jgi:hypothetical protein
MPVQVKVQLLWQQSLQQLQLRTFPVHRRNDRQ